MLFRTLGNRHNPAVIFFNAMGVTGEAHFKYRDAVMKAYPLGNYPVFRGYNHMEYRIRSPHGFAEMLISIIRYNRLPELPFRAWS